MGTQVPLPLSWDPVPQPPLVPLHTKLVFWTSAGCRVPSRFRSSPLFTATPPLAQLAPAGSGVVAISDCSPLWPVAPVAPVAPTLLHRSAAGPGYRQMGVGVAW